MVKKIMNNCFLLFFLVLTFNTFGQISFEEGYFINNSGKKTECYIKNFDWKDNPVEFMYKLSKEDSIRISTIDSTQEFGIYGFLKYKRFLVKIDKSSNKLKDIGFDKNPKYESELLFLKKLVEGKASLYSYANKDIIRYFYQTGDTSNVEQLVYKLYKADETKVGKNNYYKQQIINLGGNCFSNNSINNMNYTKADLVKSFIEYNSCINSDFKVIEKKNKSFNLSVKPGIRYSSLKVSNSMSSYRNVDYDNTLSFCVGIEAETILPFNNNKWGIGFEPTFQSFKGDDPENSFSTSNNIDYKSVELLVFVRYYIFLSDKSKISIIGGGVLYDLPIKSNLGYVEMKISDTGGNFVLGCGYYYNDLLSVELRYGFSRELLNNYMNYSSDYRSLSLTFGYRLF